MFLKGSFHRTWPVVLKGLAKPLKRCESLWYPKMKLFCREKLFHVIEHVAYSAKPHRPHEYVCALMRGKGGIFCLFWLEEGSRWRYGGKKQALEGTLNVKKRLAIKTDSVQFIVWGKLKAGWAGQSRVSLDSCSLQLHCTHVVDSKYSANGAVRREGWEERTERCLKTHEWSNWWK